MDDLWLGDSSVYDPNKVYVAASDKRGHATSVKVNVPAGLPGEVANIVAQVPEFRNSHDFYRDALVRGIMYWRERVPELEASDWGGKFLEYAAIEDQIERVNVERDLVAKAKSLLASAADSPMVRQQCLMYMRSMVQTLESESLRAELRSILSINPLFTEDLTT